MNGPWTALVAAGLLAAAGGAAHVAGKIGRGPTYKAMPVVVAVDVPATLVPLTLSAPTPEGDELFGKRLPEFGLGLDRASQAPATARQLPSLEAPLTRGEVSSTLGPDAAASLRHLAEVARVSANAPALDEASVTALDVAVAELDGSLLAAKLPYFVDATVMTDLHGGVPRRIIVLTAFSVAESNLYSSTDGSVRTVRLRRLDRLGFKHGSLGFVNPHRAQAAVLLDVVDDQVARHLLPALADGAPMPLVLADGARPGQSLAGPLAELAARAGDHARAELGAVPGIDPDALRDLGAALHERHALYEKWSNRFHPLGLRLRIPTGLPLDTADVERDLGDRIEAQDREALRAIQARIDREAAAKAYAYVRDAFADSIERHEVQHRLDLEHGAAIEPLPVPAPVAATIRGEGPRADELRDALKNELSGYVAQLAREKLLPRTTLALLLRFLVNPRTRSSTEGYAAMIATEELCRTLGIRGVAPLAHDGQLDEEGLARAYRELTSVPPTELTRAAGAAWHGLFGRDLPSAERGSNGS